VLPDQTGPDVCVADESLPGGDPGGYGAESAKRGSRRSTGHRAIETLRPSFNPATLRKRLLGGDFDQFADVIRATTDNLIKVIRTLPGAQPDVAIVQRRYPSQRAVPVHDATIHFDPRTAFEGYRRTNGRKVQCQLQWLRATYEALAHRKTNLQLQIGVGFPYDRCEAVQDEKIVDTLAHVWLACKPFILATRGEA
jgi:hypothetical protein